MPIIKSEYRCSPLLRSSYIQTFYPLVRKRRRTVALEEQTLTTPDNDFLEVFSLAKPESDTLVILSHALESHGKASYMINLAEVLYRHGHDVITWSMRSCSKTMNTTRRSYNAADYSDLQFLVDTFSRRGQRIILVGFSLGGVIIANYLGQEGNTINPAVAGAFLISPPLDLESLYRSINQPFTHHLYQKPLVKRMKDKFARKNRQMELSVNTQAITNARTIADFEEHLFAPLYGCQNGAEYRRYASPLPFMENIQAPTYILAALDDPFLDDTSYPYDSAAGNDYLFLETPRHGGHMGFVTSLTHGGYWYEPTLLAFINRLGR